MQRAHSMPVGDCLFLDLSKTVKAFGGIDGIVALRQPSVGDRGLVQLSQPVTPGLVGGGLGRKPDQFRCHAKLFGKAWNLPALLLQRPAFRLVRLLLSGGIQINSGASSLKLRQIGIRFGGDRSRLESLTFRLPKRKAGRLPGFGFRQGKAFAPCCLRLHRH